MDERWKPDNKVAVDSAWALKRSRDFLLNFTDLADGQSVDFKLKEVGDLIKEINRLLPLIEIENVKLV